MTNSHEKVDEISKLLKDADVDKKISLIEELKNIDNSKKVDILIDLLSAEYLVVLNAITALGELKDSRAIEPLINVMRFASNTYGGTSVSLYAATSLAKFGRPAIIPLIDLMKDGDYHKIFNVMAGLGEMTSEGSLGMGEQTCSNQTLEAIKKGFEKLLKEIKNDPEAMNNIIYSLGFKPILQQVFLEAVVSTKGTIRTDLIIDLASSLEKQSVLMKKGCYIKKCFKTGQRCLEHIVEKPKQIFIGMPFSDEYNDVYQYGVLPAVKNLGFTAWKANEIISNIDVMCKICEEIQQSGYGIINISDWNPNVMFELGLL